MVGLAVALSLTVGCVHMSKASAVANLESADPDTRQRAADSLRGEPGGVPPDAIAPLIAAYKSDPSSYAKAAELIALGKSGSPEAKPLIDVYVRNAANSDEQRWGGRALKYWMLQTGQLPADYEFPQGWPYGTPGYPPRIP